MSSLAADIEALDSGQLPGWVRTGEGFYGYPQNTASASPVCRFYIPVALGDSHFYSASPVECAQTQAKFPTFIEESPAVMYIDLPDATTGACPAADVPVYRVWDNRADSNHRYTIDPAIRSQMVTRGWIAEGYGPDQVIMCAPPAPTAVAAPCKGNDPQVAVPAAPHGMYVWNPNHRSAAYQSAFANDVIGKDPSLCGASLVIYWSDVEAAKGVFDWSSVITAAQPYVDAGLTVNLLFSDSTEGTVNTVTPTWVTDPVSGGGDGVPTVSCAGEPTMPVYFDAAYEAAWTAFIAAATHQFSYANSPLAASVGYMRVLPPQEAPRRCRLPGTTMVARARRFGSPQAIRTASGTRTKPISSMRSAPRRTDKQMIVSLPLCQRRFPDVYAVANLGAAAAAAPHVGFSFESLGASNVADPTSTPAACNPQAQIINLHWCQAYTMYAGQVPLAQQPITASTNTSVATIDITKLLQYALANHIQIFEALSRGMAASRFLRPHLPISWPPIKPPIGRH